MSLDPPSAGRSPAPEPPADLTLASLARLRGAPLIDGLEAHLAGAREHADACGSYAFAAAVELGMGRAGAELCRETARLHDVGKVYIPPSILRLDASEIDAESTRQLERHFEAGARLALGAGIPDDVCGWMLQARERFDGDGPDGLAGAAIPVAARVCRAACLCDSTLSSPAEGPLTTPDERRTVALAELRQSAGSELDPDVVEALVAVLSRNAD